MAPLFPQRKFSTAPAPAPAIHFDPNNPTGKQFYRRAKSTHVGGTVIDAAYHSYPEYARRARSSEKEKKERGKKEGFRSMEM
jgi:hypothetical protein